MSERLYPVGTIRASWTRCGRFGRWTVSIEKEPAWSGLLGRYVSVGMILRYCRDHDEARRWARRIRDRIRRGEMGPWS